MPGAPRRKKLPARFADDDFDSHHDEKSGRDGSLFLWTVLILILIGFAIACWIGSFYIFGHPEKPLSYQVLTKLKKLDPPKRFELTAAPRGEFLRAQQIYDRYANLTPRELDKVNETLLRNYLRNYKLTQDRVPYVVGTFNILDSYELGADNMFPTGAVALARSKDVPSVILEQVFPAPAESVHTLQRTLLTGLDIDLKRENELSAIINVEKLDGGRLRVTAVSILYPSYESATSSGTVTLEPPAVMNMAAGLPVVTAKLFQDAEKKYASYLKRAGLNPQEVAQAAAAQSRLMRVERPEAVNMPVQPAISVATAVAASPSPTPAAMIDGVPVAPAIPVLPDDAPVMAAIPVNPTPPPVPEAQPSATPGSLPPAALATPTPEPVTASASPTASPAAAIVPAAAGSWPVYAPGQMPRGRLLNVKDVASSAPAEVASQRAYLQGNFVVTASGPNRAVLRNQGAITESLGLGGRSNVRVIVEFPAGTKPPGEGATFSRDARRPFQITEVRTSEDGQVNVYVREVTRP